MAETEASAFVALKELIDALGAFESVSLSKTNNGYECTVFKLNDIHTHYEEDESLVGAIMKTKRNELVSVRNP